MHVFLFFFIFLPESPLSYAVTLPKDRCREVIITLVSGGGHIDFRTRQGQTPMHKAVLHGNQTAVKVPARLQLFVIFSYEKFHDFLSDNSSI